MGNGIGFIINFLLGIGYGKMDLEEETSSYCLYTCH